MGHIKNIIHLFVKKCLNFTTTKSLLTNTKQELIGAPTYSSSDMVDFAAYCVIKIEEDGSKSIPQLYLDYYDEKEQSE